MLNALESEGYVYEIVFLECSTPILVKRFKETRRTHPLSGTGRVDRGIEEERLRYIIRVFQKSYIKNKIGILRYAVLKPEGKYGNKEIVISTVLNLSPGSP